MADLDQRIDKFIQKIIPEARHKSYLLAVSGGIDSIAMADLLHSLGYAVQIAHCNFSLRGKESDVDEAFVRNFAAERKLDIHVRKFNTKSHASDQGISTQMAARELRYEWLRAVAKDSGCDFICTAHQLNDSIETSLFNFIKGSGLRGLTGIQTVRGLFFRPLNDVSREEIMDYVTLRGIKWREDSSNSETVYHRNLLRHKIIPVMRQINPGLIGTGKDTRERLSASNAILSRYLRRWVESRARKEGNSFILDIASETERSREELTLLIDYWLKPFGYSYRQVKAIAGSTGHSGKLFHSGQWQLCIDRGQLVISPQIVQNIEFVIDGMAMDFTLGDSRFRTCVVTAKQWRLDKDPNVLQMDYDKLEFPVSIRNVKSGDWFIPLGMKGKKKISDFMIDHKIPVNFKHQLLIIESKNSVAGIPGWQVDERFKVTKETEQIFVIEKSDA